MHTPRISEIIRRAASCHRQRLVSDRLGAISVMSAVVMIVMLGFVAFTVDVGYIELTRTQLQAAADAAALAGALELSGTDAPELVRSKATEAVQAVLGLHRNGNLSSTTCDPNTDLTFGKISWNVQTQKYEYQWGNDKTPYSVLKVRAMRTTNGSGDNRLPLLFGPAIGSHKADVGAEAVATFHPRDIMMVLDFSSSMNDDSSLGAIGTLGRSYIENNLLTMYQELGSPVYGNLTFTPQYAVLKGVAASGTIPHIDVTYKRTEVGVVSTSNLIQVRLGFSGGSTQTFSGLSAKTGSFSGTGSNSGKTIITVWVKSGTNASMSSGSLGEQFDITTSKIKTALGLTGSYPYPGGSWDEYITTVQSSTNSAGGSGAGDIAYAGYRDKYGYLTLLSYWQTQREQAASTPDLWKTSEQPVRAMKDAGGYFVDYLTGLQSQDQLGLVIYTHPNLPGGIKEHGLSSNLNQVKTTLQLRQAGHYASETNIYGGMKLAREELVANSRPRTFRLMVLMTDGIANEPGSNSEARAAVITEANSAAANKIKIFTISLGALADTALMQQVADTTGGLHFNIPGGQTASAMSAQLNNAFREVASSRILKLVSGQ